MLWNTVVTLLIVCSGIVYSQYIDGYDDGYLQSCIPELLDLTYSKDATDGLEIILVRPGKKSFKHYAISTATDILKDKDFNVSRKTMMFSHGYFILPISNSDPLMKAYLDQTDYNVLVLNAMSMLSDIVYGRAARATIFIGKRAGIVLAQMARAGFNIDTFELVGHSLGAHTAGITGKAFFKSTGKKIPRITALDPAGPCFRQAKPQYRLDKSDAEFVLAIHTNTAAFGLVNAVGHVDFYVNGGRWQPSEISRFYCYIGCSHQRSNQVWAAAMMAPEGSGFIGVECSSVDFADKGDCYTKGVQRTAIMGPNADPKVHGIFYVRTSGTQPFYLGKRGTKPPIKSPDKM